MIDNALKFLKGLRTRISTVTPPANHVRRFSLYIEDGVDETFVENALVFVPRLWQFERISHAPRYYAFGWDWTRFLVPIDANTIVIFDGNKRNVKFAGGTMGSSVGVARFRDDTDVFGFGLRIWHELLHTIPVDADGLLRTAAFEAWLEPQFRDAFVADKARYEHSAQYQALYYEFLTQRLLEPATGLSEATSVG